jgi:hypothetical protein
MCVVGPLEKNNADTGYTTTGPAHAVYFGTYEVVKDLAGGNVGSGHHPFAAGWFAHLSRWLRI